MQKVLNNIVVSNPCKDVAHQPMSAARADIQPYNRAEQEAKMGNFNLEEGINNMLIGLGDDCEFNLEEVQEFNANLSSVIENNGVQRGQNNIVQAQGGSLSHAPGKQH